MRVASTPRGQVMDGHEAGGESENWMATILRDRPDAVGKCVPDRAKFVGWLKSELACRAAI